MKHMNTAAFAVAACTIVHASVSVVLTHRALVSGGGTVVEKAPRPTMVAGTPLKGIDKGAFRDADLSMVLVFSTSCSACRASLSFYQRLAQSAAGHTGVKFLVAVTDSIDDAGKILDAHGIAAPTLRVDAAVMDIVGTPTLVLCDREGRILNSWLGKLDSEGENAVLAALGTSRSSTS